MKTISKIWRYQKVMIMLLLTVANSCKHEEQEPEKLPVITTFVSEITDTSATITGNKTFCEGFGELCFSISNWNPEPTKGNTFERKYLENGNCTCSVVFNRLTPGTTYYVRAFEYENYGNVVEFTTSGCVTGDIIFNPDLTYGSLADLDGNTYKTITIGSQSWMAENLKTTKFNDGTDIPHIEAMNNWRGRSTPAYCWYLNDESKYKNPYGALYNWHTVNTGKLCPTGWHIPSWEEWTTLTSYLGGDSVAGGQLRENGAAHWIMTDEDVTNSTGFTALPSGSRGGLYNTYYPNTDDFGNLGYSVSFWCTDTIPGILIPYLGGTWDFCYDNFNNYCGLWASFMSDGLSVRCVKD